MHAFVSHRGSSSTRLAQAFALVWLLGCTALIATPVQGQATETRTAVADKVAKALSARLEQLVESGEVPGASAAVILPDGTQVTATAGYADKETKEPMTAEHRLFAGSIGKTHFAALAVDLLQTGKLKLEDPVSKYLGKTDWYGKLPNADKLTIAHLMRHQSGLPRYVLQQQIWQDLLADPDKVFTAGERVAYVFDMPAVHEPGEGWAYSDTNYIVLGAVIGNILNEEMDEAIEDAIDGTVYDSVVERILQPHQLADTVTGDKREIEGLAQGYDVLFRGLGMPERMVKDGKFAINPQFEWCGGGFVTTPLDLARWARLNYTGQLFKHDYLALMQKDAATADPRMGGELHYGLGVMIRQTPQGKLLGHDGVFPGYVSSMGYFPEQEIAAAIQINTDNGRALGMPSYAFLAELVRIAKEAQAAK